MKKIISIIFISFLVVSCSNNKSNNDKYNGYERKENLEKPEQTVDRMSYSIGYDLTTGVKMLDSANSKVNFDYLIAGIIDGLEEAEPLMDDDERLALVNELQQIQAEAVKVRYNNKMIEVEKRGEEFAKINDKFLEDNKKKEGWKVTEDGLQYKAIKKTSGPKPAENMVISANIRGELTDGEVFENTFEKNKPIDMPIEGLVYGFKKAIMMMSVGDIYEFVVPPSIAFGEDGSGSQIPPNSVLIMKFELVNIISTVDEYRQNMKKPPGL